MQDIVLDIPYKFIPPVRGRFWQRLMQPLNAWYLRKYWGIESIEYRGLERLTGLIAAGDAVMLVPNHPRPSDPALVANLPSAIKTPLYFMASWHLFMQSRVQRFVIRRTGTFSVYREGADRKSLNMAIELLAEGKRPLTLFGEGAVTRTNDLLHELADGIPFIARGAYKKRQQHGGGRVVVLPLAIKYRYRGDLRRTANDVLSDIERRISWQPQTDVPLVPRVLQLGNALLTLKELEYFQEPQSGEYEERLERLIARILEPLEEEWVGGRQERNVIARARKIRAAILPDMVANKVTAEERARRWRHLADVYLAQQLSLYPPQYVREFPTPERILETIERLEEDLTDEARIHRPLHAIIQVGEPIPVEGERSGRARSDDPLLPALREQMQSMLDQLRKESGQPLTWSVAEAAPPSAQPRRSAVAK